LHSSTFLFDSVFCDAYGSFVRKESCHPSLSHSQLLHHHPFLFFYFVFGVPLFLRVGAQYSPRFEFLGLQFRSHSGRVVPISGFSVHVLYQDIIERKEVLLLLEGLPERTFFIQDYVQ
jgi:hypothetical protein